MTQENQVFDLDAILDATVDDLNDLPEFKPFPPGAHKVLISLELKTVGQKKQVEASLTYVEPLELTNPEDVPPRQGDKCSALYDLTHELGQGKFKKIAVPLQEITGLNTNRELVSGGVKDVEVAVVTGIRVNKNSGAQYLDIQELGTAP